MIHIGQRRWAEQADRDQQKQNSFHGLQTFLREKHSIRGWGRIDLFSQGSSVSLFQAPSWQEVE
jgi:hypothetical protein